ncbi:MAG TPA: TonB family protein [Gemmatimonadaceae bacterium]
MTLVMAYVILIAAGISATAVAVEAVLRGQGRATRWVWVAALGLVAVATVYAMVAPLASPVDAGPPITARAIVPVPATTTIAEPPPARRVALLLGVGDAILPAAWLLVSAALLVALGAGRRRYRRERAQARVERVGGHEVLLTHDIGPAVAGVRQPVVFLPRWVLALDEGSQQLLLSHEIEHVRHRDTWLLLLGAVSGAAMPWNPAVWWMVRRLRLAVEQDCDARVLSRHPGVRRYADLLLTAASRHRMAARLLAAHFGEYSTDLVRRIEAMTSVRKLSWRKVAGAAFVAAVLVAAACETPRPEPVAPLGPAGGEPAASAGAYEEIVKPVLLSGSRTPKYPDLLRRAGVEGEVLVSFDINEAGQPDVASLKVIHSTHELFAVAVREALPDMRFRPAERDGRKVKLTVQEPFTFTLVGPKSPRERRIWPPEALQETVVTGVPGKGRPALILRGATSNTPSGSPLMIVDGVIVKGDLKNIDPQTIESIEVVKGAAASKAYGPRAEHGVIRITTKSGRGVQR